MQTETHSGAGPDQSRRATLTKMAAGILWPAFLTSGVATVLVFTVFAPVEVFQCIGGPDVSRTGAYSVGFFLLWALTSVSSALTWYFERPEPPPRHHA